MNLKYRIRLKNERIIGPFSVEEIGELFLKEHIVGTEMCQQFPIGDWKAIPFFPNLQEVIDKIKAQKAAQAEVKPEVVEVKPQSVITETKEVSKAKVDKPHDSEIKSFKEFKFAREVKIDVNYEELEKKYQEENPEAPREKMDATVVLRKIPQKIQDLEKTVLAKIKPEKEKKLKALKLNENREIIGVGKPEEEKEEKQKEEKAVVPYTQLVNEKTEFINFAQAMPTINAQLSVSEVELEKQAKIEENLEKMRLRQLQEIMVREQAIEDGEETELELVEENQLPVDGADSDSSPKKLVVKKKKKGLSIIAILAFMGVFYFFLQPEEKPATTGPVYLDVRFPITANTENISDANTALSEARKLYAQGAYKKRLAAAGYYLLSLQNKFSGNEAMGEIILTYSELLENTTDKHLSANTVYKFIQLSDTQLLSDATTATGTALFYDKIGKYQTGIYTVKNFLRAGNKPTVKMLTYYLRLLMHAGELTEARVAFDALSKIDKKPFETYYELAAFDFINENPTEAKNILEEGLKYYPSSVLLLLQYSDALLKEQSLKKFEEVLIKITKLSAEDSPDFLADFYKQMGYLSAFKDKTKEASKFFKSSLALKESDELRGTLSKLEIGGDKVSQALILDSKVLGLLKKAKSEYKARNIDTAFQLAIEAVDANPEYVPSVLFQAQINTDRGFFESAIFGLQKIVELHPKNYQLKKMLTESYIRSFKFDDAERMLSELAQTKYAMTPEYASLMGQFSDAKKNTIMALKWFDRALTRDPLSDADMYKMAKILVRNKRFPEARTRLSKALLLDPKNVNYHALYAEILYEQDGTDTAIGYLRDTITELGEDPVLVSAIATAYFKSGQIKDFQAAYKKVQDLPKKDEGFYEFLISAAKLEGRKDDYVKYSRDLIKLNPGNLRIRMELGEALADDKKYDEAIVEFMEIKSMLESYPRVHYQLARVYLAKNDTKKAREMAQKEIDLNPNLEAAHFIMGEVLRAEKDYRGAVQKYEKAISLNPRFADALESLAALRIQQNYASEAIELLQRAIKEDLNNPLVHKLLGDAYKAAGQRAMAREKYEDYLKMNPVAPDKDLIESLIRNLK
jgi:tetratricopeptide (TPR) repeat protein